MAIASTTVFEVQIGGSDTQCGGGFDPALGGTDYSQQATAQATGTVTSATTTVTATTSIFTSQMVGNLITDGTTYKEITAFTSATVVTVDSAPSWTATTIYVGGCLASPGKAAGLMIGQNQMWVKAGTYSITSASTNIAGGCVSLPAGVAAHATRMSGYQTSRVDRSQTRPLLQASGITTFTLVKGIAASYIECINVDGINAASGRGIDIGTGGARAILCKALNCTLNGLLGVAGSVGLFCEATGCSTSNAISSGVWYYCSAYANTITGFALGSSSSLAYGCISYGNTGGSSNGFVISGAGAQTVGCVAYNNGQHGFSVTAAASTMNFINCIAEGNGQSSGAGYGFVTSAAADTTLLLNCAAQGAGASAFNNKTGGVNSNISVANQIGLITPTASVFTNPGSNDFSLNTVAGATLKAAGVPAATGTWILQGVSTLAYPDLGAAQHQDQIGNYNIME